MVEALTGTFTVKAGHAQMLKGGVIMDVVNAEQAKIAEEAGAVAVMALERVPAAIHSPSSGCAMMIMARLGLALDDCSMMSFLWCCKPIKDVGLF